jgi:hypothetical protein
MANERSRNAVLKGHGFIRAVQCPFECWPLEQNQSKCACAESLEGGFFLRKKPLESIATAYRYSGFAIGPEECFSVVDLPSGAEARHIRRFCGTDKSVPFQN